LDLHFEISVSDISETELPQEFHLDYLQRVCRAKAESGKVRWLEQYGSLDKAKNLVFLSSDTIVVADEKILHKPESKQEAIRILSYLSGREHSVFSGLGLLSKNSGADWVWNWTYEETRVLFQAWTMDEIMEYIERANPLDKAGAYGIQDIEGPVQKWIGSYHNVLGFPIRSFFGFYPYWMNSLNGYRERI
jgi:septum formation protein